VTEIANVWSLPLPARDSVPLGGAEPVTSGSQNIENFSLSRDGRWIYFDSDRGGVPAIWRQLVAGGEAERLTSGGDASFNPAVSPDGRDVAFHGIRNGNRDILIVPATGGPVTVVSADTTQEYNPRWSPDGRSLIWDVQTAGAGHLMRATRDQQGRWEAPTRVGETRVGAADWSPDGSLIAHAADSGIGLIEVATGRPREAVHDATAAWPRWSPDGQTLFYATFDSTGRFLIRAVPRTGGPPRTVTYATNPLRQAHRFGIGVMADRLYFGLIDRKADVWVAEVQ
jgi:Tol biopolymer transport system component